jgi:CubicO group peptidase (beta-lactamase class C family)
MRSAGLLFVLAACGSGTKQQPTTTDTGSATPPVAETPVVVDVPLRQVAAETAITTAWQATVAVPASWYVSEGKEVLRVRDPDKQLEVAFTAVTGATLADAIKAGWARIKPDFALELDREQELPSRGGWDAMGQHTYITAPDRVVAAVGLKKGDTWYVATIDGPVPTLQARGAQINALVRDMKVPGVDRESFAGKTAKLGEAELAKIDAFYEEARVQFGAPGGAIAIVHGGKVVFEKGYGVRSLTAKKPQAVTPNTKFMIGSTTKSLTTLMLARLVDQKKLEWTSKVVDLLPAFKLADPAVTAQVEVRHTVCACTGMPRHDLEFLFEYDGWTPEQRLASMAEMKPTTGFGETFQYSNEMVATGGWIGAHVVNPKQKLGPAYDAAMQSLVLKPLGMTATTFDFKAAQKGDFALPHRRGMTMDFQPIPVDYETAVVAVRPAGAAWSTVHDMAKYVALELANGKVNGTQLVSEENLLKRRQPQVKIDEDSAYGLGLFLSKSNGLVQISHGGNNLGFTSEMLFFPEHDVGVVMLSNAGSANALHGAVARYLVEVMFDGKPEAKENLTASMARSVKSHEEDAALVTPAEEAWVTPLLGTYKNPSLGELKLEKTKTGYVMNVGEWKSTLAKKTARDGTVYITTIDPPYLGMDMTASSTGETSKLTLDAGQLKYDFVKVK